MDFSVSIVNLCDGIKGKSAIVNQLLRSGTSIGANIHEANYASSRADFIAKMQIALKECYETEYWLELFVKTNILSDEQYKSLKNSCGKITSRKMTVKTHLSKLSESNGDVSTRSQSKKCGDKKYVKHLKELLKKK